MIRKEMPQVSVHIISYNQKHYIAEALQSALDQDYPNLQVVVSDDASTDGTAEVIATYQKRYPKRLVSLLNRENVGVTRNANRALALCTGNYVAFQGGDDVLMPGKISAQVAWFEKDQGRVLCGHQVEVFYQDGSRKPHAYGRKLTRGAGPGNIIREGVPYGATSIMVRAANIPPYGLDESLMVASDYLLWIEVLAGGGSYGYVDGVYARYRRHQTNVTHRHFENLCDVEQTYKLIAERYPQYASSCEYALNRHVTYTGGVLLLSKGKKPEARRRFLQAIRKNPFFLKAWIRLAQAL